MTFSSECMTRVNTVRLAAQAVRGRLLERAARGLGVDRHELDMADSLEYFRGELRSGMKLNDRVAVRASEGIHRSKPVMFRAPFTDCIDYETGEGARGSRVGGRRVNRSGAWIFGVMLAGLQACSSLGPSALSQGRPAYSEAIATTNAEQYLSWIVRMRYGLPTAQLAVSSITANIRFSSTANVNIGIGPEENFAGSLVPLSGG